MTKKENKASFKEKLNRLEEIVKNLDSQEIELEDAMKEYEEGIALAKELRVFLDKAELKIIELNKQD